MGWKQVDGGTVRYGVYRRTVPWYVWAFLLFCLFGFLHDMAKDSKPATQPVHYSTADL